MALFTLAIYTRHKLAYRPLRSYVSSRSLVMQGEALRNVLVTLSTLHDMQSVTSRLVLRRQAPDHTPFVMDEWCCSNFQMFQQTSQRP